MFICLFSPLFPAPRTWLHVPWLQLWDHDVWHWFDPFFFFTFLRPLIWPLIFPPPATRAEVTYRVWTGSVAWLGPSDCTENNLSRSDSGVWSKVKGGSLVPAHISSRRSRNLNAWNRFPRRRQVEGIWLALDCMLWPVTLVALFPALDNTVCTVSHAKISNFFRVCNFLSCHSFWCLYCIICVCFCWQ